MGLDDAGREEHRSCQIGKAGPAGGRHGIEEVP